MLVSSDNSTLSLTTENSIASPPGNNTGERNRRSPFPRSTATTILGAPPEAGTDTIPSVGILTKKMLSSDPQLGKNSNPESQIVTGSPPARAIFFTLCACQNPTHWPSGEKKGDLAPRVPGIGFASSSPNERR